MFNEKFSNIKLFRCYNICYTSGYMNIGDDHIFIGAQKLQVFGKKLFKKNCNKSHVKMFFLQH